MGRQDRRRGIRWEIGCIDSHGGMAAIGEPDNDVRVFAMTDGDDRQLLSAERMMGMGYGHESRRGLGQWGSALGTCR
jgi:hypothetical protein